MSYISRLGDKSFFGGFGFAAALAIRWAFAAIHTNARLAGTFGFFVNRHAAGTFFLFFHGFKLKIIFGFVYIVVIF
jgi:hypothetical protein